MAVPLGALKEPSYVVCVSSRRRIVQAGRTSVYGLQTAWRQRAVGTRNGSLLGPAVFSRRQSGLSLGPTYSPTKASVIRTSA